MYKRQLSKGKLDEASTFLKELRSLRLPDKYTEPLIAQAKGKEMAMKKAAAEKKVQDRLDKEAARKAAKEAKEAEKAAAEAEKAEMKLKKKK